MAPTATTVADVLTRITRLAGVSTRDVRQAPTWARQVTAAVVSSDRSPLVLLVVDLLGFPQNQARRLGASEEDLAPPLELIREHADRGLLQVPPWAPLPNDFLEAVAV